MPIAALGNRPKHVGDHIAGAHHLHPVPVPQILLGDLIGIVKRRVRHGRAAHLNRFQHREGREHASSAHTHVNTDQRRHRHVGRKLARNGPPRRPIVPDAKFIL